MEGVKRITSYKIIIALVITITALVLLFQFTLHKKQEIIKTSSTLLSKSNTSPTIFNLDYIVITETPVPSPTFTPTPKPTRTPTPLPFTSADYERWFSIYSSNQSINREVLKKIAICESGLNPRASNGIYGGLYQFSTSAWISTRIRMNNDPNPDLRFNPEEAIKTAAFKIAVSGVSSWPLCGR